jgi:hypothetical protein
LKGGLDFKLRNFLKGVQIVNAEQVVIWRGLELSQELDQPEFLSAASSPMTQVESGLGSSGSFPRKVGAEYRLGERASLQVTAEEDQHKKELLTAGPKLKF